MDELHEPNAVLDREEVDVLVGEQAADRDPVLAELSDAVPVQQRLGDSGVPLRRFGDAAEDPARAYVKAGGRRVVECFVRALFVEDATEAVESALLQEERVLGRRSGLAFQGEVHTFVAPVLLRLPRLDPLGPDPEADPPDGQLGKPAGGRRCEGRSVIGANHLREAEVPER